MSTKITTDDVPVIWICNSLNQIVLNLYNPNIWRLTQVVIALFYIFNFGTICVELL